MEESPVQDQLTEIQNRSAKPRLKTVLFSLLGLAFVGSLVFAAVRIGAPVRPWEKACSAEAKICPDGSAVGRAGPNCEFAPCPTRAAQDEAASWKTYSDPEILKFSIKYPPEWQIVFEPHLGKNKPLFFSADRNIEKGDQIGNLFVSRIEKRQNFESLSKEFILTEGYTVFDEEELIIGGERAYRKSFRYSSGEVPMKQVKILHGSYVYEILYYVQHKDRSSVNTPSDWQLGDTFNLMLSTFKFLDQSQTDGAAGSEICQADNDCVFAIRLDRCCACPEAISRQALKNDKKLVEYEFGKDYSQPLKEKCRLIACSPCAPLWNVLCDSGNCKGVYEEEGKDCYSIYNGKEGFGGTYEPGERECFVRDKSLCPCWDGIRNICIPQRHCL